MLIAGTRTIQSIQLDLVVMKGETPQEAVKRIVVARKETLQTHLSNSDRRIRVC